MTALKFKHGDEVMTLAHVESEFTDDQNGETYLVGWVVEMRNTWVVNKRNVIADDES